MSRHSLPLAVLVIALLTVEVPAQPPKKPGDLLPQGAVLRIGSARFQHGSPLTHVAFSPDGQLLVSLSEDRTACVWDAATGSRLFRKPVWTTHQLPVVFSADSKRLVLVGEGGTMHELDARTAERMRRLPIQVGSMFEFALSGHGDQVAVLRLDQALRVYDTASGKELHQLLPPTRDEKQERVRGNLTYGEDGRTLLLAELNEPFVARRWDGRTGKELSPIPLGKDGVAGRLLSSNSRYLVYWHDDGLGIKDLTTNKVIRTIRDNPYPARRASAFSADSKLLALYDADHVQILQLADLKVSARLPLPRKQLSCLAFAPDGSRLALGRLDGAIDLWDFRIQKGLPREPDQPGVTLTLAVSADGKLLFTGASDGLICLWDLDTGKKVRRLEYQMPTDSVGLVPVREAAFTADGGAVAAVLENGFQVVWNVATGKVLRHANASEEGVAAGAFSPDGLVLASLLHNNTIVLQETLTGKVLHKVPAFRMSDTRSLEGAAIAFSPDGRTLVASGMDDDQEKHGPEEAIPVLRSWELASGKERATAAFASQRRGAGWGEPSGPMLEFPVRDRIVKDSEWVRTGAMLQVSAQAPYVARGSVYEVRLLDLVRRREVARLRNVSVLPSGFAFSPDGRIMALSLVEQEVALWRISDGVTIGVADGHGGLITAVQFTPDGKRLITASTDTTVLVWDVAALSNRKPLAAKTSPQELERWWKTFGTEDAENAYVAIWKLTATPTESVAFLGERLHPAAGVDKGKITKLIADLDSPSFAARRAATQELEKLNDLAEAALEVALQQSPTLEVRQRLVQLLEKARGPVTDPDTLRALRGIETLEMIGTGEARKVLERLAKGAAEARRSVEAQRALERLQRRSVRP